MAPERSPKRQKTSTDRDSPSKPSKPSQIPLPQGTIDRGVASSVDSNSTQSPRSSFFSSWSKKAPPVAQVARDSLRSVGGVANEVASTIRDVQSKPRSIRSPSLAMTLGKGKSSRASLADVTTTMINAEVKSPSQRKSTSSLSIDKTETQSNHNTYNSEESGLRQDQSKVTTEDQPQIAEELSPPVEGQPPNQRTSWLGWLAKGDGVSETHGRGDSTATTEISKEPETEAEPQPVKTTTPQDISIPTIREAENVPVPVQDTTPGLQASRRGWLPIWGKESPEVSKTEDLPSDAQNNQDASSISNTKVINNGSNLVNDSESAQKPQNSAPAEPSPPPILPHDGAKASAWAFWSRERKANSSSSSIDKPHDGEIAVSNTVSQDKPTKASISVPKPNDERKAEPKKPEAAAIEVKKPVNDVEIQKLEVAQQGAVAVKSHKKQDSKAGEATKAESANATAVAIEPTPSKPVSLSSAKTAHNLLLPTLHGTLKLPESPSLLLRLASLLYTTKEPELKHLSLVHDPPRIKSALAIGVHGYFPTSLLRTVLGQPTGTSIKFADMAAKSIKRWTSAQGYECPVKTAALEGEGKIAERVELLWKLLLNWIEEIRKSDFVMVACHSQGVPVAIMLVAKLIQFGCVSSARICICAMAGVNMGPFPEYKSRWIGGSAGELFEFTDPSSQVSKDYLASLEVVLKFGVRLTFIGSIDDQLVSLESSVFAPVSHPHIFRAVSIDSKVHAPNFLSHLVGFALKLRNLGVQDHGLIRELSSPLAGSLYTGEGHSRIYEDNAVYDLAVSFALETTVLTGIPIAQRSLVSGGSNPYILPFAMRGILEEDFVRNELQDEAADLLKEFDDWKPTSKQLKDVKFRLEGIRSKL